MRKNNNQSHKNLCISNNNNRKISKKKLYSTVITPKNSKSSIQERIDSPTINFGGIINNNCKTKKTIYKQKRNKSIENENNKVLKINNIYNSINFPKKVIKIVSSPSITTLNNTINNNSNTINNNVNIDLRKNKTSIDFSTQVLENEDSSSSNNMLFQIINKYRNENKHRNNNAYNTYYNKFNNNNKLNNENENNTNNHIIIPTKTYYGSPKNEQRKKKMNFKMDNFQYKSFNKRCGKLKNYLKKSFKEKIESKRISNYNEINNNNNTLSITKNKNNNNKKNNSKIKNNFIHQKSNPLMKIKKNKYLSQSQVSNLENNKIISKNIINFNQSCLNSFVLNKKINIEKETINK